MGLTVALGMHQARPCYWSQTLKFVMKKGISCVVAEVSSSFVHRVKQECSWVHVVDFDLFFHEGQIWQILSLGSLLLWGHIVYNRFAIHIWIVSEENWAGLHLNLAIHFGEACYFCNRCASGWDANGPW